MCKKEICDFKCFCSLPELYLHSAKILNLPVQIDSFWSGPLAQLLGV